MRGLELIPGGVHTYSKGDANFAAGAPRLVRGHGGLVWGDDHRPYVDWGMGISNVLIGHAESSIDGAAIEAMRGGMNFSRPTALEAEAAEALTTYLGCDMIKFCKNGSDANNAAVRLARAVTGRQHIAFDGTAPFLSTADWWCAHQPRNAGTLAVERTYSHPFRFNDAADLERVFNEQPLACVILEFGRWEQPRPEFRRALTELCRTHGTMLVIDEIVSGYRYARLLHQYFGIHADLFTVGKGMGNGHAISALCGRREYMVRGGEDVFLLSTTHGAEQSGLAAAIAVSRFYQTHDVPGRLTDQGAWYTDTVLAAAKQVGLPARNGSEIGARPRVILPQAAVDPFHAGLLAEGVLVPKTWVCPCYRRGHREMELTKAAIRRGCELAARHLESLERGPACELPAQVAS
jgi:glutamate-1-semialdehyde 2,1-aminomutase